MTMRVVVSMVLALCCASAEAGATEPALTLAPPSPKPQLLVIGSFHMDNPGRDVANMEADDMLLPRRQREIARVADLIARFKPTRIAIEWPRAEQAELDRSYAGYRDGKRTLGRGEDEQLGMRLAKRFELPRIDAVDWNEMPPVDIAVIDYEQDARRLGQEEFLAAMRARLEVRVAQGEQRLQDGSVLDALRWFNAPRQMHDSNSAYFDYARIAGGGDYPGANWLQFWYGRNLKIFSNLTRLAGPGERLLVIYGAGHAPLLRQFAEQSGYFDVVDPMQYLDAEAPEPAAASR
jgi:hypothetical protein